MFGQDAAGGQTDRNMTRCWYDPPYHLPQDDHADDHGDDADDADDHDEEHDGAQLRTKTRFWHFLTQSKVILIIHIIKGDNVKCPKKRI